ncbi:MAG TPA: hypothetical protein DD400_00925 [Rhodospirillaceae bacterium]|nr:hypothetical protein [Rhodospirillaceae bacterium]
MSKTTKQMLGELGEKLVVKRCRCPKCKRERTLRLLPKNFKCADVVCDFCGYLAQVKTSSVSDITVPPKKLISAAWKPQEERMKAGIYFPLFLVLVNDRAKAVYYLSADLQSPEMFIKRKPLSSTARRAGWLGFYYDLEAVEEALVRLI